MDCHDFLDQSKPNPQASKSLGCKFSSLVRELKNMRDMPGVYPNAIILYHYVSLVVIRTIDAHGHLSSLRAELDGIREQALYNFGDLSLVGMNHNRFRGQFGKQRYAAMLGCSLRARDDLASQVIQIDR